VPSVVNYVDTSLVSPILRKHKELFPLNIHVLGSPDLSQFSTVFCRASANEIHFSCVEDMLSQRWVR